MVQQKKSERTKQKMKQTAKDLFVLNSFEATSISDITTNAGYAVGTFYKHWQKKEDLLFEIWYDITTTYMLETAVSLKQAKTIEKMSQFLVTRVMKYASTPFIKKYYFSQYYVRTHNEQAMTEAFNVYNQCIYQQLLTLYQQEENTELWLLSIAVADLLNGHILNANNFKKDSQAILNEEQLTNIVNKLLIL